jgi:hypothetical protein
MPLASRVQLHPFGDMMKLTHTLFIIAALPLVAAGLGAAPNVSDLPELAESPEFDQASPLVLLAFGTTCSTGETCQYTGAEENQTTSLSCASGTLHVTAGSCLSYLAAQCNGQITCTLKFSTANCGGGGWATVTCQ